MKVTLSEAQTLSGELKYQAYSALDATGTLEIFNVLHPRLTPAQAGVYKWSRAQQSPAFAMTRRGILVDEYMREDVTKEVKKDLAVAVKETQALDLVANHWDGVDLETGFCPKYSKAVQVKGKCPKDKKNHKWVSRPDDPTQHCEKCLTPRIAEVITTGRHKWSAAETEAERKCEACGIGREKPAPFEPTSSHQCDHLLYNLLLVPIVGNKTSDRTTDDNALDQIKRDGKVWVLDGEGRKTGKRKLHGLSELCELILTCRDLQKQRGFLTAQLSTEGRFHASFNVAAAWTGRWSSSRDPYRRGSNLQNVAERLRRIFIADPGHEIFYADLKTAESLQVAYLSGDENYIEAHKGDVHTYVCRLLWPDLPWTGDIKADKKIAANTYPPWDNVPGHDYRFQSKRCQHGSNYGLSPFGMAMIAHIPVEVSRDAQRKYFTAFPEIRAHQRHIQKLVEGQETLVGPLGRVVSLFGRPWDGGTYKQGLAFGPQGGVADVLDLALWRVWHELDPDLVQCMAQVHDAILGQYRIGDKSEAIRRIVELMQVDVPITDFRGKTRTCTIPVEIAVGHRWGKRNLDPNKGPLVPDGLEEVK